MLKTDDIIELTIGRGRRRERGCGDDKLRTVKIDTGS
jgi:hypothetical protein